MAINAAKSHWSFWIISTVALIWNLLGVLNFLGQLDPDAVSAMPDSHRALIENRPLWGTLAFGIAVFGGVAGCLLLLLRNRMAIALFVISLVGIIVQLIPSLITMSSGIQFSAVEIVLAFIMPVIIGLFLIGYARRHL